MNSANVGVLIGRGDGTFAAAIPYASGGSIPYSLAVGDFDNDGRADIAMANWYGQSIAVLGGQGDGSFAAAVPFDQAGAYPYTLATGDLNGDGFLDIASTDGSSNTVGVMINTHTPRTNSLNSPHGLPFDVETDSYGAGQLVPGPEQRFRRPEPPANRRRHIRRQRAAIDDSGRTLVTGTQTLSGLNVHREVARTRDWQ